MSHTITVYGISNCDTVKRARNWLDTARIVYRFHDYRKQGLDINALNQWVDKLGWQTLLNKRGTTWRQLPEAKKATLDRHAAIEIMLQNPAIIKRPLLDSNGQLQLGFSDAQYQALFAR